MSTKTEGPYTAYYHTQSNWWRVNGPTKIDSMWARQDFAEDRAKEMNAAYAAGQKPRWIPVSERLPEFTGVDVLVANEFGVALEAHRWNNVSGWIAYSRPSATLSDITHWMPLPEAPTNTTEG